MVSVCAGFRYSSFSDSNYHISDEQKVADTINQYGC